MRALCVVVVVLLSACTKKPAPKAPAEPANVERKAEPEPTNAPAKAAPGDPCSGGEKPKKP